MKIRIGMRCRWRDEPCEILGLPTSTGRVRCRVNGRIGYRRIGELRSQGQRVDGGDIEPAAIEAAKRAGMI